MKTELSLRLALCGAVALFAATTFAQTLEVLHSFNNADGASPFGSLVQASDGTFYGTTEAGGTQNYGTVFKMTPNGELNTLVTFDYGNGAYPFAALVRGNDENLYGTTYLYGSDDIYGLGTVFRIAPDGTLTTLHYFPDWAGGAYPYPGLVKGSDGNLYGLTAGGGDPSLNGGTGLGTVFKITPAGELTTMASFNGVNGAAPQVAMVLGNDGNFYGTTQSGEGLLHGQNSWGTVFKMTPEGTVTTLASFDSEGDQEPSVSKGAIPNAPLVQGKDGNFYGTTEFGGANGYGTIFRIGSSGLLTTLFSFTESPGGYYNSGLVKGADDFLYGMTPGDGITTFGKVYRMTLSGAVSTVVAFHGSDGAVPRASLCLGSDGNLYGTTTLGGLNGYGTVFRVLIPRPIISLISPDVAEANSGDLQITISGSGFEADSIILWTGSTDAQIIPSFISGTEIIVSIPAWLLVSSSDIATATVRVQYYSGEISDPKAFTIVRNGSNVADVESAIVPAGQPVTVSIPPASADEAGVAATLTHDGQQAASVSVAIYNNDPSPTGASFEVAGSYLDVNVSGATLGDSMDAFFQYPAGANADGLVLKFYDQASAQWKDVSPVFNNAPQRRFEVHFDANSHPKITELTGTFFAPALPDRVVPTVACANVTIPCSVAPLVAVVYPAPALSDNIDAPSQIAVSYSIPSGSGFKAGTTTVTCTATDRAGNTASTTFTVTRQALGFNGFLSPIGGADATGGSFSTPLRTFKFGSTIPVKFTAGCDGAAILTGVHRLQAVKYSNSTVAGTPIVVTAQDAVTTGNQFRLVNGAWQFNLDTKGSGMSTGIWRLVATLSDGSEHSCWIRSK